MHPQPLMIPFKWRLAWRPFVVAASLLLTIALSSGTTWYITASGRETDLADQLVASYARSMLTDHVTDMPSSDQHTVKPWLDSKLDIAPPVFDLTERGFPLVGGRVDYIDHRPVAAMVYKRGLHFIDVFVWPGNEVATPAVMPSSVRGYNLRGWSAGEFTFWAVSDADRGQLEKLEQRVRGAASSTTAPTDD